eukprot:scaffold58203_cov54-Phaeocystis_antarctica.AAC.2
MRMSQRHTAAFLRLARYGVFVSMLVATVDAQTSCWDTVSVVLSGSASYYQSSRPGDYTKMVGVLEGGRSVYKLESSPANYLYYWTSAGDWRVGPDYSLAGAGLASQSYEASLCPEDASSWEYYGDGTWNSGGVAVACPSSSSPPPPSPSPPPPALVSCTTTGYVCFGYADTSTTYCQTWASNSICYSGSCVTPFDCSPDGIDR